VTVAADLVVGARAAVAAVRMRDVTVAYGDRVALDDVDLDINAGALLAVIGPNGAGKSTLLKAIAGLITPVAGTIEVLGAPPGDDALESVGMAGEDGRQIGALSGGQRRRVFLARAMAARPDLYLLDEPVTGVDATTEEDLMRLLEREAAAGRTVIASTHDLAAAAHHFHEVALVNGRIVAVGPSDLVMNRELLRTTYGGHVVVLPEGEGTIIDDAHHHDDAPQGERHFHEGRS